MHTYYEIHELALLFPEMSDDQFSAFVADIQANEQQFPGLLFEGKLIDGRHRQKVCKLLGKPFIAEEYMPGEKPTHDEALKAIVSRNLLRRHMTTSERGYMAAKIASAKKGGQTRKFNAKLNIGIPTFTTSASQAADSAPQICGESKQSHSSPAVSESAAMFGVSERTVETAKKIIEHGSEELNQDVQSGKKTLNQAEKDLKAEKLAIAKELLEHANQQQEKPVTTQPDQKPKKDKPIKMAALPSMKKILKMLEQVSVKDSHAQSVNDKTLASVKEWIETFS